MPSKADRPGLIQHQVRLEVHQWIKEAARKLERSQRWFLNKLVEEAYALSQQNSKESNL